MVLLSIFLPALGYTMENPTEKRSGY